MAYHPNLCKSNLIASIATSAAITYASSNSGPPPRTHAHTRTRQTKPRLLGGAPPGRGLDPVALGAGRWALGVANPCHSARADNEQRTPPVHHNQTSPPTTESINNSQGAAPPRGPRAARAIPCVTSAVPNGKQGHQPINNATRKNTVGALRRNHRGLAAAAACSLQIHRPPGQRRVVRQFLWHCLFVCPKREVGKHRIPPGKDLSSRLRKKQSARAVCYGKPAQIGRQKEKIFTVAEQSKFSNRGHMRAKECRMMKERERRGGGSSLRHCLRHPHGPPS